MTRTRPLVLFIALMVSAMLLPPCLGMACGIGMFALESAGEFAKWTSLGTPPDKPIEIRAGDASVVYVATQANRIYGCQHRGEQTRCWFVANELPKFDSRVKRDVPVFEGEVPPPPGAVISQLNVTQWSAETADETRYALLADGTVWKWEYSRVGSLALLGNLLVGFIGGAMLGVPLAMLLALGGGGLTLARRLRARQVSDA